MHLQNDKYSRIVCFRMLKLQKQKWNDMKKKNRHIFCNAFSILSFSRRLLSFGWMGTVNCELWTISNVFTFDEIPMIFHIFISLMGIGNENGQNRVIRQLLLNYYFALILLLC